MKTDPFKGSTVHQTDESSYANERHRATMEFCNRLSAPGEFNHREAYNLVQDYLGKYGRWFYSDITNYIFAKSNDDDLAVFTNNLSGLQTYACGETKTASFMGPDEHEKAKRLEVMLDKFLDHSNLAQRQKALLGTSEENFSDRFKKHAEPYSDALARDLSKELISLVSIFTALSFLVFGGISSLDNIFEGVGNVPIIELVIVGCVWSFCILNLVFTFVYLVSKLTKLSIRVVDDPKASLAQKYPFWVWSNYLLLFVFTLFCWLYYIDYSNSGGWFLAFSQQNSVCSTIIGSAIIFFLFAVVAWVLLGHPSPKKDN